MSRQRFDPYAILRELENPRTFFVVIGGLARVIQGSDELTEGLDIAPSLSQENLRRVGRALENMNARRVDGQPLDVTDLNPEREPVIELTSDHGQIKIVPEPAGTRGYDLAARYVAAQLAEIGLQPAGDDGTFFQAVPLVESRLEQGTLTITPKAGAPRVLTFRDDFMMGGDVLRTTTQVEAPVAFAGFGIPVSPSIS